MVDFIVSISNIFIDDILTYDGEIQLNRLGGAGPHALAGCRVWHEKELGLIACAGSDFSEYIHLLKALNIDTSAIQYYEENTTSAWQLFQPGGVRVQVFKYPKMRVRAPDPVFSSLDIKYQLAKGYHILWNGTEQKLFQMLEWLRQNNPHAVIILEPAPADLDKKQEHFKRIFQYVDVFSPNMFESESITGLTAPKEILHTFIQWGCKNVSLRAGESGSFFGSRNQGAFFVPPAESEIVDQTGAGNAYVGGLVCGLSSKKSIQEALAMAAVSASFEMQQYGLNIFTSQQIPLRDERYQNVLAKINAI